jgi:hypothetical protein
VVRSDIGRPTSPFSLSVWPTPPPSRRRQHGLRDRYVRIIDGLTPSATDLPGEPLDHARLQYLKQQAKR